MILFTGGFPFSGKSHFLEILSKKFKNLDDCIWVSPKRVYPDNFDELSDKEKSGWAISAWEICLEEIADAIDEYSNDTLLIFDTAAAKVKRMRPLFENAKAKEHTVVYAFIHASLEDRKLRTVDNIERFEKSYAESFKITVPKLKKLSDKFMIIKNPHDSTYINLHKFAENLSKVIIKETKLNASDD